MKNSTEDKVQGTVHQVKGAVKEGAGKITNNPELEIEGKIEKNVGKLQRHVGDAEKAIEDRNKKRAS